MIRLSAVVLTLTMTLGAGTPLAQLLVHQSHAPTQAVMATDPSCDSRPAASLRKRSRSS